MKKILHIISSPKGENSFSVKLGNAIINKITDANPGSTVQVKDLTKNPFPHLEEATLNAFLLRQKTTPPKTRRRLKTLTRPLPKLTMQTLL
jgi:FMN-dependent NADH-azoreductase